MVVLFLKFCCAVVYLDADTIVVKNIEDLFKCGKFCANLKHSERLNSGVMVVEPSETVFNDMMSKVSTLPSYTGGKTFFWESFCLINKFYIIPLLIFSLSVMMILLKFKFVIGIFGLEARYFCFKSLGLLHLQITLSYLIC